MITKGGLYKNKYRIASARYKDWDYSDDGFYFVTICTKNKELFFEDVINGQTSLNQTGALAEKYWLEIPDHFSNIMLDEFVVMPNHIHGILIIDHDITIGRDVALQRLYDGNEYNGEYPQMSKISPKQKTLSTIIRSYKSAVTKMANKNFAWQTRFHDRIIRNQKSLDAIRNYINNNPAKWELDRNNSADLWI